MLKRPIKYTDWEDNEVTETFYFNFTMAELIEMQFHEEGGLDGLLKRIIDAENYDALVQLFKKIILAAYGVKSEDGRRFVKDPELSKEFTQTGAYSALFMELATDANAGADFVNGIMPKQLVEQAKKAAAQAEAKGQPPLPPTAQ